MRSGAGGADQIRWGQAIDVVLPTFRLGTCLAWLVTAYDFPGQRLLDGCLLLPLAVPT